MNDNKQKCLKCGILKVINCENLGLCLLRISFKQKKEIKTILDETFGY